MTPAYNQTVPAVGRVADNVEPVYKSSYSGCFVPTILTTDADPSMS